MFALFAILGLAGLVVAVGRGAPAGRPVPPPFVGGPLVGPSGWRLANAFRPADVDGLTPGSKLWAIDPRTGAQVVIVFGSRQGVDIYQGFRVPDAHAVFFTAEEVAGFGDPTVPLR